MHIHFSFFFVLCACVCVFFILCNFIAILFSAWPSHLARLALAISKWLWSFFLLLIFSPCVYLSIVNFWARNKDCCCCCCCWLQPAAKILRHSDKNRTFSLQIVDSCRSVRYNTHLRPPFLYILQATLIGGGGGSKGSKTQDYKQVSLAKKYGV